VIRILLRAAGTGNVVRDALITLAAGAVAYVVARALFSIPGLILMKGGTR